MKIAVKLKEIGSYSGVELVFRGWQTAQQWIEETLLAKGPYEVEVIVRAEKEPKPELIQDADE